MSIERVVQKKYSFIYEQDTHLYGYSSMTNVWCTPPCSSHVPFLTLVPPLVLLCYPVIKWILCASPDCHLPGFQTSTRLIAAGWRKDWGRDRTIIFRIYHLRLLFCQTVLVRSPVLTTGQHSLQVSRWTKRHYSKKTHYLLLPSTGIINATTELAGCAELISLYWL